MNAAVRWEKTGTAGRTERARTFQALRHKNVSALGNAGASLEHRKLIMERAKETMTAHYSHIEAETLRPSIEKSSTWRNELRACAFPLPDWIPRLSMHSLIGAGKILQREVPAAPRAVFSHVFSR